MKNIKITLNGIKSVISLKAKDLESPKIIKTKIAETKIQNQLENYLLISFGLTIFFVQ